MKPEHYKSSWLLHCHWLYKMGLYETRFIIYNMSSPELWDEIAEFNIGLSELWDNEI